MEHRIATILVIEIVSTSSDQLSACRLQRFAFCVQFKSALSPGACFGNTARGACVLECGTDRLEQMEVTQLHQPAYCVIAWAREAAVTTFSMCP